MVITTQVCSISHQSETGRTVYLKKKMTAAISKHFPASKDAPFDYKAEFDDELEILTIRKDV